MGYTEFRESDTLSSNQSQTETRFSEDTECPNLRSSYNRDIRCTVYIIYYIIKHRGGVKVVSVTNRVSTHILYRPT